MVGEVRLVVLGHVVRSWVRVYSLGLGSGHNLEHFADAGHIFLLGVLELRGQFKGLQSQLIHDLTVLFCIIAL